MRNALRAPCPACKQEIEYIYQIAHIPYFSEVLIESATCPCGWRMADVFVLNEGVPSRSEMTVQGEDDLSVRVVRSSSGTIEVPELGVEITPGPASEGFITNVEGVLVRIDAVLDTAVRTAEGEELEHALALKERIALVREGRARITLIIDDPSGSSAIIRDPGDAAAEKR
ncbi:MAG: zinc finger protein [Methanofollis sp.]|nr:zinc finger protein [Methanofollis sp.]